MTDKQQIESAFHEIVESGALSKSQHSQQLLEYLVKTTLEGRDIKEYTIANEVFGKEEDTGVRAYIYNLRKKLAEYYTNEGANSTFLLTIPKGQYHVQIQKRKTGFKKVGDRFSKKGLLVLLSTVAVILVTAFILYSGVRKNKLQHTLIWGDIIESEEPLLLVVGDHYFFQSRIITGNTGTVRDFNINSEKELDTLIEYKYPSLEDSIQKINYSYTTKQGPMSVFQISSVINRNQNVKLVLSSELTFEQVKTHNILFLGKFVTMGEVLKKLTDKYFRDSGYDNGLQYIQKDTVIRPVLKLGPSYQEDYPVVLKFKTPYKKTILMFMSGDDPGNAAVIDYFLDHKNIAWIEKELRLSEKENLFSALFKVVGLERTDYSIEFISGSKISDY